MAGIYIHIPFCKQACFYCDFHFSTSLANKEIVLEAITKELGLRKQELEGAQINTIYFGGGTPSLLSKKELLAILDVIEEHYDVASQTEITLEANPDDLSSEKILELKDSPINRLSIGIQSFFEEDLKFMNRAHTAEEAKKVLTDVMAHFENVTIDLIYGVPGLTNEKWMENLKLAFEYGVPHISSYALTVEEKTALSSFIKKGKVKPLDEALASEQFYTLISEVEKEGFVQYEISNFGKPGYFSKHNTSYWSGEKYLGIGPSAHSFNGIQRSWNVSNNTRYVKSITNDELPSQVETLSVNDRFNEYIMTGLRTIWGVSLAHVKEQFGEGTLDSLLTNSKKYIVNGLLEINENECLVTSTKGKFMADGIASDLFILTP